MRLIITFLVFLLGSVGVLAQEYNLSVVPDSLLKKSYKEIFSEYGKWESRDSVKALFYAKVYLKKAKTERNNYKIANAFSQLSSLTNDANKGLRLTDSIEFYSRNFQDSIFPALTYIHKSSLHYTKGNYKESNDYALKALGAIRKNENENYLIFVNSLISSFYTETQNYRGKIELARDNLESLVKKKGFKYNEHFFYSNILSICSGYEGLKMIDSLMYYAKFAIKRIESTKSNFDKIPEFESYIGKGYYFKNKLDSALYYINTKNQNDYGRNLGVTYSFNGFIYNKLNKIDSAFYYFSKADSIFQATQDPFDELLDAYQIYIDYYKEKDDKEKQLAYINKYLYLDSIIDSNQKYISKGITEHYEIPKMLAEKEAVIAEMERKKAQSTYIRWGLIAVILVAIGLALFYYRRQRIYKKRFLQLIKKDKVEKQQPVITLEKAKKGNIIPVNTQKEILAKLQEFEENKLFNNNKITLSSLAKDLETNSSYLSKVINNNKGKTFANYLNQLRVEHAVMLLENNPQMRLFSIKAIAKEVGFNTAESFSKAFFKQTGIYPSYFIKQLDKKKAS